MIPEVQHDQEKNRFFITNALREAYLTYSQVSDTVLDFRSTFVPEVFRGQGVAATLVKAALDYAKDNGFTVIPTCSFVDAYIRRNPDKYGPLVRQQAGKSGKPPQIL
jgi:uncharacterized protein